MECKHTVNDLYTTIINAHMDAAENSISKRKRVKKTSALGERTCQGEKERIEESLYEK